MEPIMLISKLGDGGGNAQVFGGGMVTKSLSSGGQTTGFMADRFGSQSFSFAGGPLGQIFNSGGQTYSLRPDFVSRSLFGPSWSVFQNGLNVGSLWTNAVTPSFGWSGLGSKLAAGMISALKSSGSW